MAVQNIREARRVLEAYGITKGTPATRRQQLSSTARLVLQEMAHGLDMPVYRVRETLGSDVFDAVTLDASHNDLQGGFGEVPDDWRSLAKIRTTPDFKDINSSKISGLANLLKVPENGEYLHVAQSDEKVTYAPDKHGVLLGISLEASFNDAIGAFNDQVGKLGRAAKNTLNEAVLGTNFDDNPTMDYDTVALFNSAHNNLLAAASPLTHDNVQAAIAALLNQTGLKSEKIYPRPLYLAVNPARAITAYELVKSAQQVGGSSTVPSGNYIPQMLLPTVLVSPHLDAATADWYLIGNIPCVEVAFVRGQQAPEILREPENTGRSFLTDSITWKVRYAFGAQAIEHRGVVKGDAA